MISQVSIRNFQSLKKVDLELGPFTVIVGDSATGKSAFIRAIKAVSSNVRGTSLVTSGESSLSVSLQSEFWKVTLEKGVSSNSYKVCDLITGAEKEYTKLAGEVPEDVTALLGLEPVSDGRSVNFAGERDQPYLLDDSGQQVAKALGDLTNVATLLEAIREANRRRNGYSASLKVWNADLKVLQAKLPKFASLAARKLILESAESKLGEVEELTHRVTDLKNLIQAVERTANLSTVVFPEIPSYTELDSALRKMRELAEIAKALVAMTNRTTELSSSVSDIRVKIPKLENQFNTILTELGECPTCHQRISTDHITH